MKRLSRIAAILSLSVAITLALSNLPQLERTVRTGAAIYADPERSRLTDQNLVDALVSLPLELRIIRAELRQSVLSVDLAVPQGKIPERSVYLDLYELSRYGFTATTNVNQVLVRIMELDREDPHARQLLLAMDARRENRPKVEGKAAESSKLDIKAILQSHYAITLTQKWKDSVNAAPE